MLLFGADIVKLLPVPVKGRHFLICRQAMFIIEKVCIRADTSITRTRTIPKNESEFLFKKSFEKEKGKCH
jgi:hypothetical protein